MDNATITRTPIAIAAEMPGERWMVFGSEESSSSSSRLGRVRADIEVMCVRMRVIVGIKLLRLRDGIVVGFF